MTVVHAIPAEETGDTSIRTTLYDLIAAISGEVAPEEEGLVIATVMHLLRTRRAKFLRDVEKPNGQNGAYEPDDHMDRWA